MSGINININLNMEKKQQGRLKADRSTQDNTKNYSPLKKKKRKSSNIPWGLNQERLKNYLVQELLKQDSLNQQQQQRKQKIEVPKPDRREMLGVSFLNHLPQKKVKKLVKKQKPQVEPKEHVHCNKFDEEELEQIRLYKEWKQRQIEIRQEFERQQEEQNKFKIKQNLMHLDQYIKYRNKTTSIHKKSQSFHKKSKKKKSTKQNTKTQQLFNQFTDLQARFAQLTEDKKQDSCFNLGMDSDQEFSIDSKDESSKLTEQILEPTLDADEQKQIQEIGLIEKQMSGIVKAVIRIQKSWRGYKTRQILKFYKDYIDQNEQNEQIDNEEELSENQLNKLIDMGYLVMNSNGKYQYQGNQDAQNYCESVQKCKELSDQQSSQKPESIKNTYNQFIEDLNFDDDDDLDNFNVNIKESSIKPNNSKNSNSTPQYQLSENNDQIKSNSNKNIVNKKSKEKWQEMLQYISALQKQGSQQDLKEILKNLKKLTLECSQEIKSQSPLKKTLFIEIPHSVSQSLSQSQSSMGEMRKAMGSEKLLKITQNSSIKKDPQDQSLFVQNPFLDFASKKFRELLNRNNMETLIQIREQTLEERNQSQLNMIKEQLTLKQISPKTYQAQHQKLEKWVTKEKSDLQHQKKVIEIGWNGLFETFMRTQRDIIFMSKLKHITLISSFSSEAISNFRQITSNSQQKIQKTQNQESGTMCLSSSICESQDVRKVPKSSPSPSPRHNQEQQTIFDDVEWDDDLLYTSDKLDLMKLQNSQQVLKVSNILREQMSEQQIQSYSILITNQIVGNEIQDLFNELITKGIDITSSQKRKGFKTNLNQVKLYLNNLKAYLLNNENVIKNKINCPLGPTPKEILKYLHYYDEDDELLSESSVDTYSNQAILLTEQFAILEKQLMENKTIQNQDEQMTELEHIHNKVIFDAMNESLDQYRPYGVNGYPLPWSRQHIFVRSVKSEQIPDILQKASDQVIEWSSNLAGIIIDKADSPFPKVLMYDVDYLNQIKEERMIRMLNTEIIENEEKWLNYAEESTEILVDVANIVFDELLDELVGEMN